MNNEAFLEVLKESINGQVDYIKATDLAPKDGVAARRVLADLLKLQADVENSEFEHSIKEKEIFLENEQKEYDQRFREAQFKFECEEAMFNRRIQSLKIGLGVASLGAVVYLENGKPLLTNVGKGLARVVFKFI